MSRLNLYKPRETSVKHSKKNQSREHLRSLRLDCTLQTCGVRFVTAILSKSRYTFKSLKCTFLQVDRAHCLANTETSLKEIVPFSHVDNQSQGNKLLLSHSCTCSPWLHCWGVLGVQRGKQDYLVSEDGYPCPFLPRFRNSLWPLSMDLFCNRSDPSAFCLLALVLS